MCNYVKLEFSNLSDLHFRGLRDGIERTENGAGLLACRITARNTESLLYISNWSLFASSSASRFRKEVLLAT